MEQKINIAELLKDCPAGMELDCLLCNNPIELEGVLKIGAFSEAYPIRAVGKDGFHHVFTAYGASYNHDDAKCVIFPKGKNTWEGFVPPCKFKDGDILYCTEECDDNQYDFIFILKEICNNEVYSYCFYYIQNNEFKPKIKYLTDNKYPIRLATEEEKQKLFQAIKDNGYRWNAETKTLENLPKDKFDITTLVPFESKVLVRCKERCLWCPAIFGFYKKDSKYFFVINGLFYKQCVPYENNQHLLGSTNDCDTYYKTWE